VLLARYALARDLVEKLMVVDDHKRFSVKQALQHPFVKGVPIARVQQQPVRPAAHRARVCVIARTRSLPHTARRTACPSQISPCCCTVCQTRLRCRLAPPVGNSGPPRHAVVADRLRRLPTTAQVPFAGVRVTDVDRPPPNQPMVSNAHANVHTPAGPRRSEETALPAASSFSSNASSTSSETVHPVTATPNPGPSVPVRTHRPPA
jgi:hypothetical protein